MPFVYPCELSLYGGVDKHDGVTFEYGYSSRHKYLDVKKKIKNIRLRACFGVVPPKNQ